jgi:pimeloyl-ACP methyl ester carboxylesterase
MPDPSQRLQWNVLQAVIGDDVSSMRHKFELTWWTDNAQLMLKLGYDEYITQGGDWGYCITRAMAHLYPKHVKAHHVNWAWAAKPEFTESNPEPEYSEREKRHMAQGERWYPYGTGEGRGYIAIQVKNMDAD